MDTIEQYKRMVEQEDSYLNQITTVEMSIAAIIDHIYRHGEHFDRTGVKDILESVHEVERNLRSDLLQLRLEKVFLAYDMK
jgi:hypothetical protein